MERLVLVKYSIYMQSIEDIRTRESIDVTNIALDERGLKWWCKLFESPLQQEPVPVTEILPLLRVMRSLNMDVIWEHRLDEFFGKNIKEEGFQLFGLQRFENEHAIIVGSNTYIDAMKNRVWCLDKSKHDKKYIIRMPYSEGVVMSIRKVLLDLIEELKHGRTDYLLHVVLQFCVNNNRLLGGKKWFELFRNGLSQGQQDDLFSMCVDSEAFETLECTVEGSSSAGIMHDVTPTLSGSSILLNTFENEEDNEPYEEVGNEYNNGDGWNS